MRLTDDQKSSPSSSFLRLARKARPVAVAKAPKARAADESSSPVLGRAWLPCLCLGSLTSEEDTEVLIEADNEVLADSLIEVETLTEAETLLEALADSLSDVDSLVETETLNEAETLLEALADSETLNELETDWLVEIEALVLCDSETDVETD